MAEMIRTPLTTAIGVSPTVRPSPLAEIAIERAELERRRDEAAKRDGDKAVWIGSELPIDTRTAARREYSAATAALEELDEREARARAKERMSRRRDIAAAQDAVRVKRIGAQNAIARAWQNLTEAWRTLDEIDAPLRAAGADIPRHVSARQLEILMQKLIEDAVR